MKNIKFIFSLLLIQIAFLGTAKAQNWLINGNNGIGPTNFLGTKNNADLILKTNSLEVARFTSGLSASVGKANTVDPSCTGAFAAGKANLIDAGSNHAIALGHGNEVTSADGFALGRDNLVTASHAGCIGSNLQTTADHAITIGSNITNSTPNSIQLGVGQLGVFIMEGLMGGIIGINTTTPSPFSAIDVNGDIYSYGVWIGSDKRFKKEVRTLDKALDKVLSLRGTEYFFTNDEFKDKNFPVGKQIGFIAQEMEQVMPDLVRSNNGAGYTVNYIGLIPVLVEAMKEQQTQIEEKDAAISCLQNQLSSLEARLARIEANMLQGPADARAFEQPKLEKAFGIAPNPTNGHFQINLSKIAETESSILLIFDGNGREVARQAIEAGSTVANVNFNLPNGSYNISLLMHGKLSSTQTLVVAK